MQLHKPSNSLRPFLSRWREVITGQTSRLVLGRPLWTSKNLLGQTLISSPIYQVSQLRFSLQTSTLVKHKHKQTFDNPNNNSLRSRLRFSLLRLQTRTQYRTSLGLNSKVVLQLLIKTSLKRLKMDSSWGCRRNSDLFGLLDRSKLLPWALKKFWERLLQTCTQISFKASPLKTSRFSREINSLP